MKYEMTRPCSLCPFRNDKGRLYVSPDRLREFARGEFVCHQTAAFEEDDEYGNGGGYVEKPNDESQHCAGALIFGEKFEWPHQMARIMERIGQYDPSKLDMDAPVFGSWAEVEAAEDDPYGDKRRRRARRQLKNAKN